MEIKEVEIKRILNPTAIDLGEYVINPYRGCEFSCLYCYVRFNKVAKNDRRSWGEYVDVRVNAPERLEKELAKKKPERVLLGSTTECFQPLELKYKTTNRILEVLNENRVYYNILTRSTAILHSLPLLKKGFCENVYFTVNSYDERLKKILEPRSESFLRRAETVDVLMDSNIPLTVYFSPVLPYVSDIKWPFSRFKKAKKIEFEGLNFNLGNIRALIEAVSSVFPGLKRPYEQMAGNGVIYGRVWSSIKKDIALQAARMGKAYELYVHGLNSCFSNRYRS